MTVVVVHVYDTMRGALVPLEPATPGEVRAYVCGITPYDRPHVGYARLLVVWDVIRRHLERRGYVVTLVQNVTDVDDRIIARAAERGVSTTTLADEYTAVCLRLMRALDVAPPDYWPRATDHMEAIRTIIARLLERDLAYVVGRGTVYFRVRRFPGYGRLSHREPDALRSGVRVELDPGKEDPLDFALWKEARPGEPHWPAPWGAGRPGWHVECSAMAWDYLGPTFDLHGGGMDLVFPHHENERAQSEAALGVSPHVGSWLHTGLITTGGVKMSKSLGNAVDPEEICTEYSPAVLRAYLLSVHYRSPMEFSRSGLDEFHRGLMRVSRLWRDVEDAPPPRIRLIGRPAADTLENFPRDLLAALDQDFNTARAWALTFDMVRAARVLEQEGPSGSWEAAQGLARRNLRLVADALGPIPHEASAPSVTVPDIVTSLVREREAFRRAKNWREADRLRDAIRAAGWIVEDRGDGPAVKPLTGQAP